MASRLLTRFDLDRTLRLPPPRDVAGCEGKRVRRRRGTLDELATSSMRSRVIVTREGNSGQRFGHRLECVDALDAVHLPPAMAIASGHPTEAVPLHKIGPVASGHLGNVPMPIFRIPPTDLAPFDGVEKKHHLLIIPYFTSNPAASAARNRANSCDPTLAPPRPTSSLLDPGTQILAGCAAPEGARRVPGVGFVAIAGAVGE